MYNEHFTNDFWISIVDSQRLFAFQSRLYGENKCIRERVDDTTLVKLNSPFCIHIIDIYLQKANINLQSVVIGWRTFFDLFPPYFTNTSFWPVHRTASIGVVESCGKGTTLVFKFPLSPIRWLPTHDDIERKLIYSPSRLV